MTGNYWNRFIKKEGNVDKVLLLAKVERKCWRWGKEGERGRGREMHKFCRTRTSPLWLWQKRHVPHLRSSLCTVFVAKMSTKLLLSFIEPKKVKWIEIIIDAVNSAKTIVLYHSTFLRHFAKNNDPSLVSFYATVNSSFRRFTEKQCLSSHEKRGKSCKNSDATTNESH